MRMAVAAVAFRQPPLPFLRLGVALEVILIKATPIGPAIGELQHPSSAACQPLHGYTSPALDAFVAGSLRA